MHIYFFYTNFVSSQTLATKVTDVFCMNKVRKIQFPDYVFETSWEVCNKVGGIYAVLSTRAETLQKKIKDHVIFIGPDCWTEKKCPFFKEDASLFSEWVKKTIQEGLHVRVGRWTVPGEPIAILVDFKPLFSKKNELYGWLWNNFQVDSLHAYGDYDESLMFSFAAGRVVESFYKNFISDNEKVVFHVNEWQTAVAALYIQKALPQIATIFTTHATGIGRSIAGNNKPLYDYLEQYNGDQMARELNMESKHSVEKQTAKYVDCFTTVSEITARECKELLDKPVDFVLPNGFEDDFVPKGAEFTKKRNAARGRLLSVANALTGCEFSDDTMIVSTSGRYEFRNKGIDVFIDSMNRLGKKSELNRKVVAFIEVPGWVKGPRKDLQERLQSGMIYNVPLPNPVITHELYNEGEDRVLGMMRWNGINNDPSSKVKIIFVPTYLIGDDGIINLPYYDVLIGADLCVFPSYYEPWGYTPLEAVAFKVPCVTTDLAGFGLWVNSLKGKNGGYSKIEDGVEVVHRTDSNYDEVCNNISSVALRFALKDKKDTDLCRRKASMISKKALWSKFFRYYEQAYSFALDKAEKRVMNVKKLTL